MVSDKPILGVDLVLGVQIEKNKEGDERITRRWRVGHHRRVGR